MVLSNSSFSGIYLPKTSIDPDSDQPEVGQAAILSCRRLKRGDAVTRVEFIGSEMELKKRGSDDLTEEGDESSQGPSKALCVKMPDGAGSSATVGSSGAVETLEGKKGEISEREDEREGTGEPAKIHPMIPVACLPVEFSGELEMVTRDVGFKEEDNSQSCQAGAAEERSGVVQESAGSAEHGNFLEQEQTDIVDPIQRGISLALLNRFPSINGEEEENILQVEVEDEEEDGGEEEAGEVGERWSRASSELDQVWYR